MNGTTTAFLAIASLASGDLTTQEVRILVLVSMVYSFGLAILISWPLARRTIKPNRFYGLRTKATLADERVWFDANEYAARLMMRAAGAGIVLAVGLFLVPGLGELYVPIMLALLLFGALGITWRAARYARSLERAVAHHDEAAGDQLRPMGHADRP